jgi:hypothetical protein
MPGVTVTAVERLKANIQGTNAIHDESDIYISDMKGITPDAQFTAFDSNNDPAERTQLHDLNPVAILEISTSWTEVAVVPCSKDRSVELPTTWSWTISQR